MMMLRKFITKKLLFVFVVVSYCHSVVAQTAQQAFTIFLNDSAVRTGFAGVSIFEPATNKYILTYNADKNFVPSSNVKLFTLYAGLKYLGDSIVNAQYTISQDTIYFEPMGDPTFLHKDFTSQPFINFLKQKKLPIVVNIFDKDDFKKYGNGWAWDDYADYYSSERTRFSTYGNVITFTKSGNNITSIPNNFFTTKYFAKTAFDKNFLFEIKRNETSNNFYLKTSTNVFKEQEVPFTTQNDSTKYATQITFLADILQIKKEQISTTENKNFAGKNFYARPIDSLLKPMMHRSDNFFAEQTLLMVSNQKLGYMSDAAIIDTLLKTDFKYLPNKPTWVDGSGLSRYNLFSPNNFVYLLNKMQAEFGLQRLKNILPTGGQGTLTSYYQTDAGYIFAKSGSMSANSSLSGYLISKKNKLLIFSVQINNYFGSGKAGRKAIEKFLKSIRENN